MDNFSLTGWIVGIVDSVLRFIGDLWMPIWAWILQQPADALIVLIGNLVLFALGILLTKIRHKRDGKFYEKYSQIMDAVPFGIFWPCMIMRILYPLIVTWFGAMALMGGAVLSDGILSDATFSFYNYPDWIGYAQVIGAAVVLQFLLSSAVSILRFKPLSLLQFWVTTVDYLLLGRIIGRLYVIIAGVLGNGLLGVLFSLFGIFLNFLIPIIFCLAAFLPVYCAIAAILSPIAALVKGFRVSIEMKDGKVYTGNMLLLVMDMLCP